MKKLSAILLICLFAISQYARQLRYLECKFYNTFNLASGKCDCEKQTGFGTQDPNQMPLSKIHAHAHPDEFFSVSREVTADFILESTLSQANRLPGEDECKGNYLIPWQPPIPD